MDIDEEKYFVSLGMRIFGGSFVKCLGEALSHADGTNTRLIKQTWTKYWKKYLKEGINFEKHAEPPLDLMASIMKIKPKEAKKKIRCQKNE